MCGTDYEQYIGAMDQTGLVASYPIIPGHEMVGRIERIGRAAEERWGVSLGDRVAVEPGAERGFIYSYAPLANAPGLWGGYADDLWLRPATRLHRVADVDRIIVTGLARDSAKLALAEKFGATDTLMADQVDVVAAVRHLTNGRGVDRTLDVSAFATQPIIDAIELTRFGGTIVLAGLKGMKEVPGFISDKIPLKRLTIRGMLGNSSDSFAKAIDLIASGRHPLHLMHSHTLTIDDVDLAMRTLGSEVEGEDPIHITIGPG